MLPLGGPSNLLAGFLFFVSVVGAIWDTFWTLLFYYYYVWSFARGSTWGLKRLQSALRQSGQHSRQDTSRNEDRGAPLYIFCWDPTEDSGGLGWQLHPLVAWM